MHFAHAVYFSGIKQDAFRQRGFTGVNMGDDAYIPQIGKSFRKIRRDGR
jgi:hypothetical protein